MEFRDLKRQYQMLKPKIDRAMQDVAAAGNYIMGDPVKALEQRLAEYVGVKHCMSCANGTDALTLALKALGIGKGDAVFVPDFTFFASAEVVALEGATPVFVDVHPQTFNIDSASLQEAINNVMQEGRLHPKAIIAVDLFGLPADFSALRPIAEQHNLYLIEDGAQGFGGRQERIAGKRACGFADIGTTSFFPAKPLGCYGDGGAVFTDNDEWAELIRSLRVHGKGSNKYDNVRIGMNSRLDTVQAAILNVKLDAFIDHELDAVNTAAAAYTRLIGEASGNVQVIPPSIPEGFLSSWAQYTLRLSYPEQDVLQRREALQARLKANGIPSMVYYPIPMSLQTAFKETPRYAPTPHAQYLAHSVLSLPMHPYLTNEEISFVVESLMASL